MNGLKRLILIALLLLLAFIAGCTANPTDSGTSAATGETTATESESKPVTETTGLNNRPDAASGVLRLWWSDRESLNPLHDRSQSGKTVNKLIFQGLFIIDSSRQCQFQLARDIRFTANGKQVMIDLAPNIYFHDGSQLTAADVVACVNFILSHPDESGYYQAIQGIKSITTTGPMTLRVLLSQADPWFPYALTFPVIPANSIDAGPFELVSGTGPFRMHAYNQENGLTLKKVSQTGKQSEMTTISLTEFGDITAAMQAFEDDRIDLVNLTAEHYSRYMLRNSLRFDQYTGNQLLFLAYNTQEKKMLADSSRLLFLKRLLNPAAFAKAGAADWGESTPVPVAAVTWMIRDALIDQQMPASLGKPVWEETAKSLKLLNVEGDSFQQQAMDLVCSLLDGEEIAWQLESLPADEYWPAIAAGAYDLTIMNAVMPAAPDPSWLYRDDRPGSYGILNSMAGSGLAEYDDWRLRLLNMLSPANYQLLPSGREYAEALAETAARSPWSVLMIRSDAILYGDRVIGQLQPEQNNPYQGIEELWIWSGQ